MLSAFTARPIVELKQRDKSKVESILAYGDRLLVGLNTGSLRIYRINEGFVDGERLNGAVEDGRPSSQPTPKPVELLREYDKFSKYKIEQLALIKEANILISLSNNVISIHELSTYELQETLTKAKGASAFAVTSNIIKDTTSGIPSIVSRLAVAVKRHLLLWSWHDSELMSASSELTLTTSIKTLTWATATHLFAGLSSSYVLVNVETSEITDIVGPGSIGGALGQDGGRFGGVGVASMGYMGLGGMIPKPLATKLGQGEVLLAKDINTLFVDTDGNPLGRRQIPWAVAPEAVGYSYPFLLALQATKGTLEARNPETLTLLQTIPLSGANQLHVPQPNVSLAHAGKGFLVSSERCIWRMSALGYDSQVNSLVQCGRLDEALSLLNMLEDALVRDKVGRIREIKMMKAQDLFDQRKYRDSLDLFNDVSAPPERVIRLYPPVIAGEISSSDEEHEVSSSSRRTSRPQNNVETVGSTSGPPNDNPAESTISISASMDEKVSASDSRKQPAFRIPRDELGKDLETATIELQGFLVGARTKLQRYLNFDGTLKSHILETNGNLDESSSAFETLVYSGTHKVERGRLQELRVTANLVDTTLFRAYMFARPSMAGPLFRLPNFCDVAVVNTKLMETSRYNDLVDFFFGKRLHQEALELLQKFGKADDKDETAPVLRGPKRTVSYLQSMSPEHVDLILEFIQWPMEIDPDLGMEVFLADTENAESLPRSRVMTFLRNMDKKLEMRYLEHLVRELDDSSPEFHQRLIDVYLEELRQEAYVDEKSHMALKAKLISLLKFSEHYEAWNVARRLPKDNGDFYEARAIVLGKMGEHRQALEIYVFKLGDPGRAEEYCNQIYMADSSSPAKARSLNTDPEHESPSIYRQLLSLYLSPPPPHKPQWDPALAILARHGSRLPASTTLNLIPEVLLVKDLESYFQARIRSANTVVNEGRIIAGLRKTVDLNQEAILSFGNGQSGGRNRKVTITDERLCGVCHRRFGGSVIKVLPDDTVVHYGCSSL